MVHSLHRWIALSALSLFVAFTAACSSSSITVPEREFPVMEEVSGDTTVLEDSLTIIEIEAGAQEEEARAVPGREVEVAYTLWLEDGTGIDQSDSFTFIVGTSEVVEGFWKGVSGMGVGGKRRLIVPPELGYGEEGSRGVPGDATLVFDVELLSVQARN